MLVRIDAYDRMAWIYGLARRQAPGVNHAIEDIIARLTDSPSFERGRGL